MAASFRQCLKPDSIKSYTLSDDGHFQIFLVNPCYVKFSELVHYDKVVEGKLKNGSITDISGIQEKKVFAWLPITGIHADLEADTVEFQVGFLFEKLPAKLFKDIPSLKYWHLAAFVFMILVCRNKCMSRAQASLNRFHCIHDFLLNFQMKFGLCSSQLYVFAFYIVVL